VRYYLCLIVCLVSCGCQKAQEPDTPATQEPAVTQPDIDLFAIYEHVFGRADQIGYGNLTEPEKVFYCIWILEGQVNNGGLDQYYFNSSGDYAADAVASLDAIGAKHTANLVRQANAMFGEAGPSPERFVRQDQLEALDEADQKRLGELDQAFYKYHDKLDVLLKAYVRAHKEAFGID